MTAAYSKSFKFQSTHPARGATHWTHCRAGRPVDFNPRTPRGVRHALQASQQSPIGISIHAPREGCDQRGHQRRRLRHYFNPRTPRGVRRPDNRRTGGVGCDFNPRTPRGVRHHGQCLQLYFRAISIHAPREGCDKKKWNIFYSPVAFQSTHPARGATKKYWNF